MSNKSPKSAPEEWWMDWQKELATDNTRNWTKRVFKNSDGYSIGFEGSRLTTRLKDGEQMPEGARLEPNSWDHEHCKLCWTKISESEGEQHDGYSDGKEWICVECYDKYIKPE
jgi:hypothetical protein